MPKKKSPKSNASWGNFMKVIKKKKLHLGILGFFVILIVGISTGLYFYNNQLSLRKASANCTAPNCGGGGSNFCSGKINGAYCTGGSFSGSALNYCSGGRFLGAAQCNCFTNKQFYPAGNQGFCQYSKYYDPCVWTNQGPGGYCGGGQGGDGTQGRWGWLYTCNSSGVTVGQKQCSHYCATNPYGSDYCQ